MNLDDKWIARAVLVTFMVLLLGVVYVNKTEVETAYPEHDPTAMQREILPEEEPEPETEALPEEEPETEYTGERSAWVTTFGKLNVRAQANTESDIQGHFVYRQEITVSGVPENGFYAAVGEDSRSGETISGWCHQDYLTFEEINDPAVYLDVPAYKQTDGRWAGEKIGSTKKTIGAIGCTTTCLAMTKSFIEKTTVYPDDMEELLWYDKNGNLGWPKTYTTSRDSTYYMETIFEQLHKQIPVLVGATKKNGKPHWVLVVGYSGDGQNFYPSDFLINDPLPDNRTNLADFFGTYPKFYKMAYYTGVETENQDVEADETGEE